MQSHVSHPWHHVSPGPHVPEEVHGIIEIPRGSRTKFEMDKATGLIKLDRVLYSSVYYPAHYGFIPQTLGEDGDPLDVLVLTQADLVPMCLVTAHVIGVMQMIDQGKADDKIIAVAIGDPSVSDIQDIQALPDHLASELRHFFEEYTKLEGKTVKIEAFLGKREAFEIITESVENYHRMFGGIHTE